jgi:Zn-dependent M28 family amino/carboxypeptidase
VTRLAAAALAIVVSSAAHADSAAVADPQRLEHDVRAIVADFGPRDHQHPENLERVAGYIEDALKSAGARVTSQRYDVAGKPYRNVIASFGPADGERIVVGAHYDTFGAQPGADDNASGVAGLMELARLLTGAPLRVRVDLVAFTLEEPPHFRGDSMGSAVHAKGLRKEGVALRAMIALEMIGCFSDEAGSQGYPVSLLSWMYPSRGNFIGVVGNFGSAMLVRRVAVAMRGATPLPVEGLAAPRFVTGVDFSDHASYWDAGYEAVMITDTAFFRYAHYHTMTDTPDRLDYARMAQVVQGVRAAVLALAQ